MLKEIIEIIELTLDEDKRILSPRAIFNENYLLNLVMYWFMRQDHFIVNSDSDRKICKAFQLIGDDARCYNQATLETPFKVRNKGEKDPLAEASPTVSAVVGHFKVLYGKKKERITLLPEANQFIIIETTLNKALNKGTRKFKNYNQVARNISCMIQTISHLDNIFLDHLGLYVVAPKKMLQQESFKTFTYKQSIDELIKKRVEDYGEDQEKKAFLEIFNKIFQRIEVDCISYEDILRFIKKNDNDYSEMINNFYKVCLRYHGL